ncbi:hypothetical protein K501DRAFT_255692 [Backusella circina FSU 941]|nr:hypothetical protein K501DRAFT_255692 [Backusella circina FSU 941]
MVKQSNARFSGTDNGIVSMSETVGFCPKRLKYHLEMYNKYSVLEEPFSKDSDEVKNPPQILKLPVSMKIKSKDIDHLSGCKKLRKKLQKEKKLVKHAKVVKGEALQSKLDFYQTTDMDILKNAYADFVNTRQESRSLYYSHSSMKATRKYELQKQRQVDVLCSSERKFVKGKKNPSIMFTGDRGYGVGSPIKGHLKYGGKWKQEKHSKYTPVVITNEFNTSQTCLYCFEKLEHPLRKVQKKDKEEAVRPVNGAFECVNSKCILNITGRSTIPRDRLSALAVGLSGLTKVLFGATFPPFDYNISQSNTELFNQRAALFRTGNRE